jgi:DNA-directed RNA polymerase specialized sigma24 family protein
MKPRQDISVDVDAVNAIFWQHYPNPTDPNDAEDVLSEAMLKAWNKVRTSAKPIQNVKAWFVTQTSHHCIDILRKRDRLVVGDVEAIAPEADLVSQSEIEVGAA